jgi:hypothetical protein
MVSRTARIIGSDGASFMSFRSPSSQPVLGAGRPTYNHEIDERPTWQLFAGRLSVAPSARHRRASFCCCGVSFGGRPMCCPRAVARLRTSAVRVRIRSRRPQRCTGAARRAPPMPPAPSHAASTFALAARRSANRRGQVEQRGGALAVTVRRIRRRSIELSAVPSLCGEVHGKKAVGWSWSPNRQMRVAGRFNPCGRGISADHDFLPHKMLYGNSHAGS